MNVMYGGSHAVRANIMQGIMIQDNSYRLALQTIYLY